MKSFFSALVLLAAILPASPAAAQITGAWRVSGKIGGTAFVTNCRFAPNGNGFGGECINAQTGKHYGLTTGSIAGDQVRWGYPVSFMMMKFDMIFAGTLNGGSITGTATAHGHKGAFTATRTAAAP